MMSQSLALEVVAEGVETEAQLHFLKKQGCERMQGFHVSEPTAAEDLEPYLIESAEYGAYRAGVAAADFFFQAEDGIRDTSVTGVQTCALPISEGVRRVAVPGAAAALT